MRLVFFVASKVAHLFVCLLHTIRALIDPWPKVREPPSREAGRLGRQVPGKPAVTAGSQLAQLAKSYPNPPCNISASPLRPQLWVRKPPISSPGTKPQISELP